MRPVATQPRQLRDRPHQPPRFGSKIGEAMPHDLQNILTCGNTPLQSHFDCRRSLIQIDGVERPRYRQHLKC